MMSIVSGHHHCQPSIIHERCGIGTVSKVSCSRYCGPCVSGRLAFSNSLCLKSTCGKTGRRSFSKICSIVDDGMNPDNSGDEEKEALDDKAKRQANDMNRANLERMVGTDDSAFNGLDLATLIRQKYGRSYDVQLIKKEFMGRNLLAMNVMWKYREQRSFPLTEEEYILRLDDVANMLKCWGAVSHIRNSLAKSKERPRIGKAVSIFIDMDSTGGRANEWIYK
ncbi:hypothetical protein EUTSA_v10021482mg [Eutrema salsugineum]|uniref:Uncharacterized protein n=1 Tax=Eutrema salsugineum TaxID=72664 RepID=V4LZE0_EUTSA|nr:uncharacterized protein LOC18025349 [Eutrema salsugineum]ESQ47897.1 hypothetical protein EUTSA_v10021482mg [Eutrema salsugineum]